jgi:hypothetical protein
LLLHWRAVPSATQKCDTKGQLFYTASIINNTVNHA